MSSGQDRREEILATAAELFASSGIRTPLSAIAAAAGVLPGSLYHHFDSKEAIVVELIGRYQADLDRISCEALDAGRSGRGPVTDQVTAFGTAIARCAVRHRAAVLLTFYEPPAASGDELVQLAKRTPVAIHTSMVTLLRAAETAGELRPHVDLVAVADLICQNMLQVAIGAYHQSRGAAMVPEFTVSVLLHGLAAHAPADRVLDRSVASRVADRLIASWGEGSAAPTGDRAAQLLAAARSEFARRGYEATTIRDVASAAGMSTALVYRLVGPKEDLLTSIMVPYRDAVLQGWRAVLESDSTTVEQLDALMWFSINAMARFGDERKIQTAWLRMSPPSTPRLQGSFPTLLRLVKALLAAGARSGELEIPRAPVDLRARCVVALVSLPESTVRDEGTQGARALARETVLRGAALRSTDRVAASH